MSKPILVDTSVWIDYLKGEIDHRTDYLYNHLSHDFPVLICPIILQELLQGIRTDVEYRRVKSILLSYTMLEIDPVGAAIGAANLYRSLQKKGITIRKSNDCLIAYFAITHSVPLLHNDKDYDLISTGSSLITI